MGEFGRYSYFTRKCFDQYLSWNFKKNFSGIYTSGSSQLENLSDPLLFVSNHVSWWDGFFLFELQRRIRPKARLFTIALKETCEKNPILTRMGVLPLEPGKVASLTALLKHLKFLRHEGRAEEFIAAFFPQGRIRPSFASELGFQRGIEGIVKALSPITIVPIGIHIEPMIGKKPTAVLQIEEPISCVNVKTADEYELKVRKALGYIHQTLFHSGEKLDSPFERWST